MTDAPLTGEPKGYYIALISLHGLVRGAGMELGRDADTGGQIKYVVELARALGEHRAVERVDLLTRSVVDHRVSGDYSMPCEKLSDKVSIIRIPFGPRRYLAKERLWPSLDTFVDKAFKYFRAVGRSPDILHAHYADAGYVSAKLAALTGSPLVFTGHSLGRVKKKVLMEAGAKLPDIERQYHVGRRIDAEEMALQNASFVVTSTHQEVEEQYKMYDHYAPRKMTVIPPGVNLSRFHPPARGRQLAEQPSIVQNIVRSLHNPSKPLILAIARPDEKKNLTTLLTAFGENEALRERANMVLVAGSRDDIATMKRGPREELTRLLLLIDKYDLYGEVAYPKKHTAEDVPILFQMAARNKGVFVNPALTEPFGLTLIEAAASGLPIVATNDGGPRDIVAACRNGILIDPGDSNALGEALLDALSDSARWKKWSRGGINGAHRHFSWTKHVHDYLRRARTVINRHRRRQEPTLQKRIVSHDRLLVCDIDNTLVGNREALQRLMEKLYRAGDRVGFAVATGRSRKLTLKALKEWGAPTPNLIISSVGSAIYYGANLVEDTLWKERIDFRWRPDQIRRELEDVPGLKLQPLEGQDHHKISYFVDPHKAPGRKELIRRLRRRKLPANVIYSHGMYLDILPARASKGLALRYIAIQWDIPVERCLVAGDSGNDEEMLTGDTLAVVVGNHSPELNHLIDRPRIYFAKGKYANGIIEGIDHYRFFDDIERKGT